MKRISDFKHICLLLICILSLTAVGCKSDGDYGALTLGREEINDIPVSGGTFKVIITSGKTWTTTASDTWFRTEKGDKGISRTIVTIVVDANLLGEARRGTLTFATENETKVITLTQKAGEVNIDQVQYKLPVVFHVLYSDQTQAEDRPSGVYITEVMERVNKLYKPVGDPSFGIAKPEDALKYPRDANDNVRPNMNIDFVMADKKPDGTALSTPGIHSVKVDWTEAEYTAVLHDKSGGVFHSMAWDRSQYINIFVFKFKKSQPTPENPNRGEVHGATFLPSLMPGHSMSGFEVYSASALNEYNHVIVINTAAFTKDKATGQELYNPAATIAHELGHYLGLYHTFAENETHTELSNTCVDSDHCEDTPSYERVSYMAKLFEYGSNLTQFQYEELLLRMNCEKRRFYSTNIMDYDVSHKDMFTADQRKRIRAALYFSPLIPGLKLYSQSDLKAAVEDPSPSIPPIIVCGPHSSTSNSN